MEIITTMTVGDWVLVVSVVVALTLGIRSIRHSNNLYRQDHKQRLLNEIVEWAEDTANIAFGTPLEASYLEGSPVHKLHHLANKHIRYQVVFNRRPYVTQIAECFGDELHSSVLKVDTQLLAVMDFTSGRIKYGIDDQEKADKQKECEYALRESASNLIKVVTDIKVKLLVD